MVGLDRPAGWSRPAPTFKSITKEQKYLLKQNYKKILICLILVIIIFSVISNLTRKLRIHFIDVGQRGWNINNYKKQ